MHGAVQGKLHSFICHVGMRENEDCLVRKSATTYETCLRFALEEIGNLRVTKTRLGYSTPHALGTTVEDCVASHLCKSYAFKGVALRRIHAAKKPDHPMARALKRLGKGVKGGRAGALNDPTRLFLPGFEKCPPTLVKQPFGTSQGCLDIALVLAGRVIPISVKGWDGGSTIKHNSAPIHAGVVYVCISYSEKTPNLVYHGTMLGEYLHHQRVVSEATRQTNRRIQGHVCGTGPLPIKTTSRSSHDVSPIGLDLYLSQAGRPSSRKGVAGATARLAWSGGWVAPKTEISQHDVDRVVLNVSLDIVRDHQLQVVPFAKVSAAPARLPWLPFSRSDLLNSIVGNRLRIH